MEDWNLDKHICPWCGSELTNGGGCVFTDRQKHDVCVAECTNRACSFRDCGFSESGIAYRIARARDEARGES